MCVNTQLVRTRNITVEIPVILPYRDGLVFEVKITHRRMRDAAAIRLVPFGPKTPPDAGPQLMLRSGNDVRVSVSRTLVSDPDEPRLRLWASHGSVRQMTMHLWLSPLPLDGPLDVTFSWPSEAAHGRATIDASELARAAECAMQAWSPDKPAA